MKMTTVGIDLAKHVFQLHGIGKHGKPVLKKQLKREQMVTFFANLLPMPDWHGSLRQRPLLGE